MGMTQVHPKLIYQPRDQRKLFGRADRAANPGRLIRRGLTPGVNILKRLGKIEIFERIVKNDLKPLPRQSQKIVRRKPRSVVQDFVIQRRVVPPIGADLALAAHYSPQNLGRESYGGD